MAIPATGSMGCDASGLFQLDERAVQIFRVEEDDGLAMRADLRLAGTCDGDALDGHLLAGGADVLDLDADVVDAALRVLRKEAGDGRVLAQGLQQFDLGVAEIDENGG